MTAITGVEELTFAEGRSKVVELDLVRRWGRACITHGVVDIYSAAATLCDRLESRT